MHFPCLKLSDKVEKRSLFFHDQLTRIAFYSTLSNLVISKEVCNGGVTCSLLKLGSLEKTVIASRLHSGTIFLWKKRCHMSY